ncbi:MAG: 50S ribosomal protein L10 [Geobacteraceae bacterium]|nr:50S ribosomal protein L10 [Geobacteraceae bacterium]
MNKQNKQQVVSEMHEKLTKAKAVFLADFRGMTVGKATTLRNELRNAEVEYRVVKNTLLELACADTDAAVLIPYFKGPTAVAMTYSDPVAAAKVLAKYAKDQTAAFKLKGGVLSGKTITAADVQALSELPSREVLIAKMLGSMNAPATNFVGVLAAVPGSFVRALDAIRQQKQAN